MGEGDSQRSPPNREGGGARNKGMVEETEGLTTGKDGRRGKAVVGGSPVSLRSMVCTEMEGRRSVVREVGGTGVGRNSLRSASRERSIGSTSSDAAGKEVDSHGQRSERTNNMVTDMEAYQGPILVALQATVREEKPIDLVSG